MYRPVFCAVSGVQSQSETVWKQAEKYRVPKIAFINKMDRNGASIERVVSELKDRFSVQAVPLQLPIGKEKDFSGVIDLVDLRAWSIDPLSGEYAEMESVPSELQSEAQDARMRIHEVLADLDDSVVASFLNGDELSSAQMRHVVRSQVIQNKMLPVFCGSAIRNIGIHQLLDAVVEYLPSPVDRREVYGYSPDRDGAPCVRVDINKPFSALVFKVMTDRFLGKLAFVRVYSGSISSGSLVANVNTGQKERILRIFRMHANHHEDEELAEAGDILAFGGLKNTKTGHTLAVDPKTVQFEVEKNPETVVSVAIEPRSRTDQEKLFSGLTSLNDEDPSFSFEEDKDTGQMVLRGMGELHLEILVERLLREYGVHARVGKPEVAYREAVTETAEIFGVFDREIAGVNQWAKVVCRFSPAGNGFEYIISDSGEKITQKTRDQVEQAFKTVYGTGVLVGYPLTGLKVELLSVDYKETDNSQKAIEIATSIAYRNGLLETKPIILEPIMGLEITVPEEYLGDVISSVLTRMGRVEAIEDSESGKVVLAYAPMRNLFGLTTTLRGLTKGRSLISIQFSHYDKVPQSVQEDIVGKYRG
ncbi:MAG: elongation factor G [Spirochaetia bacterium]